MLDNLKKKFPGLYDEYLHLQRRKLIKQIEKIKKIPEEQYPQILAEEYQKNIGRKLDWGNLQTYTEKMQWEKIYDKNPLKSILADKYRVRQWIADTIGEEYLIPLLGCWDDFESIDFDKLPSQFVLKTNHGTDTNLVVKDKATFNRMRAKKMFDDWMQTDYAYKNMFQLHYGAIPRKIIAERYLETGQGELPDYKFLCFEGIPRFCWVDLGRYTRHTRTVFNMNWEIQPWTQYYYGIADTPIEKPANFEKMKEVAATLSQGFSHVRVDLYNVNGTIYFGEMTFTNASGFERIIPDQYDYELGKFWHLPTQEQMEMTKR